MSSYCEQLRARITTKRRKLEEHEALNLVRIGGSINAHALVKQELRRQIAVDEELLANEIDGS
jgi:hypothetical protein